MTNVLIIGATRGLGASLAKKYASQASSTVYGTTRSEKGPIDVHDKVIWVPGIDVSEEGVSRKLVNQLGMLGAGGGMTEGGRLVFDVVVCTPITRLILMRKLSVG
ncbi:oxidoreductase protein [Rutstroemia sp. NJR-2017a BVV2]|nr:oxidoreductase protein [Rutstroemia sp. NJR-2017a BVV2]